MLARSWLLLVTVHQHVCPIPLIPRTRTVHTTDTSVHARPRHRRRSQHITAAIGTAANPGCQARAVESILCQDGCDREETRDDGVVE